MGAFGKGEVNSNVEVLLEVATNHELILIATHYYMYITKWLTAPHGLVHKEYTIITTNLAK